MSMVAFVLPNTQAAIAVVVVEKAQGRVGENWGGRDGEGREDSWAL